jgi:hypothetical protein
MQENVNFGLKNCISFLNSILEIINYILGRQKLFILEKNKNWVQNFNKYKNKESKKLNFKLDDYFRELNKLKRQKLLLNLSIFNLLISNL